MSIEWRVEASPATRKTAIDGHKTTFPTRLKPFSEHEEKVSFVWVIGRKNWICELHFSEMTSP